MKTTHTITVNADDLLAFLKEKLEIQAHVLDINMTAKSAGQDGVVIDSIKLEWVKDTNPPGWR